MKSMNQCCDLESDNAIYLESCNNVHVLKMEQISEKESIVIYAIALNNKFVIDAVIKTVTLNLLHLKQRKTRWCHNKT